MYLRVPDPAGFVFTQAFQSIGLGLASGIGAAIARPDRLTVACLGDGGALMALPELETLARLRLPMLVVIYNDAAYGAEVHHFRPQGHPVELVQFPDTDFAALAAAAGARGLTVRGEEDLAAIEPWLASARRPAGRRCEDHARLLRGMARGGLQMTQSLAEMLSAVDVVDLTQPLSEDTPVLKLPPPFANTPGLTRHEISRYDDRGPAWAWDWLEIGEHVGHALRRADPLGERQGRRGRRLRAAAAAGRARGGDRQVGRGRRGPRLLLTVDHIREFEAEHGPLPENGWLLLRTGWDARAHDEAAFLNANETGPHTPGFDVECARWLAEESPLVGVGVETVGTDAGAAHSFDPPFPVHTFLLGAGKYGLTQLANLAQLPPTGAVVVVAPLKLVRRDGQPGPRARARPALLDVRRRQDRDRHRRRDRDRRRHRTAARRPRRARGRRRAAARASCARRSRRSRRRAARRSRSTPTSPIPRHRGGGRAGAGGVRRHRHPRQQRRDLPDRPLARGRRGGVGRGLRHQRARLLPARQGGAAADGRPRRRVDRQRRLGDVLQRARRGSSPTSPPRAR